MRAGYCLRFLFIGFLSNFLLLICFNLFPISVLPYFGNMYLNTHLPGFLLFNDLLWYACYAIYYCVSSVITYRLSKNDKIDRLQAAIFLAFGSSVAVGLIACGPQRGWAMLASLMSSWYALSAILFQVFTVTLVYNSTVKKPKLTKKKIGILEAKLITLHQSTTLADLTERASETLKIFGIVSEANDTAVISLLVEQLIAAKRIDDAESLSQKHLLFVED